MLTRAAGANAQVTVRFLYGRGGGPSGRRAHHGGRSHQADAGHLSTRLQRQVRRLAAWR